MAAYRCHIFIFRVYAHFPSFLSPLHVYIFLSTWYDHLAKSSLLYLKALITVTEFLRYTGLDLVLIKDWVRARSGKALKHDRRNTILLFTLRVLFNSKVPF